MPDRFTPGGTRSAAALQIAVIGCGPKGLYCLERLAYELRHDANRTAVEIVVFEPSRYPGAGPVYDPNQPHYLRMNFASRHINAWINTQSQQADEERPSLVGWLRRHHPAIADPDAYIPRAIAGEYFHWCFNAVVRSLPGSSVLRIVPHKAASIERAGSMWKVRAATREEFFDEVLITVGHEGWRSSSSAKNDGHRAGAANYIPMVFPVTRQLSLSQVRRDSVVAVRGFSLTFIDAALAMTEGRGGQFVLGGKGWNYVSSGLEPKLVIPFSRTGRPMLAKPDVRQMDLPSGLDAVWAEGRARLLQLSAAGRQQDYASTAWPNIAETAAEALCLIEGRRGRGAQATKRVSQWFREWSRRKHVARAAIGRMARSYGIAVRQRAPDEAWALGEAWRQLYTTLVKLVSHGGLTEHSWTAFRMHAVEMERIAFGPPAENVGRILALIRAGRIDLRFLASPELTQTHETIELKHSGQHAAADHLINAVLPASSEFAPKSILRQLVDAGAVRRFDCTGGLIVDENARPVGNDGRIVGGLAIFGRPTEGWILGNDTLSRRLHPHPANWARTIANLFAQRGAKC